MLGFSNIFSKSLIEYVGLIVCPALTDLILNSLQYFFSIYQLTKGLKLVILLLM